MTGENKNPETEFEPKTHQLSFELMAEVVSVIMDTGWAGSAEEYIQTYHGKTFAHLTTCEAEIIVRALGNKPGCIQETDGNK